MSLKKQGSFSAVFLLVLVLSQTLPLWAVLILGAAGCGLGLLLGKKEMARPLCWLCGLFCLGHLWMMYSSEWLRNILLEIPVSLMMIRVLVRFCLVGYLVLFLLWRKKRPPGQDFFALGERKGKIRMPGIWWGKQESLPRFLLIFCGMFLAASLFIALQYWPVLGTKLVVGLLFSLVNAPLEEMIWRGLILSRLADSLSPPLALVTSALGFGVYHLSLGFPLWACLIFAVGGFYMGGAAMVAKGLVAPVLMHVSVNLLFVAMGIIF